MDGVGLKTEGNHKIAWYWTQVILTPLWGTAQGGKSPRKCSVLGGRVGLEPAQPVISACALLRKSKVNNYCRSDRLCHPYIYAYYSPMVVSPRIPIERLRADVDILGSLLGDVLREQGGDALLETVERLRKQAIAERVSLAKAEERKLPELAASLDLDVALEVSNAFGVFFHLVNLAEENHRLRNLRQREAASHPEPQYESIGAAIGELARAGVSGEEIANFLPQLLIKPVFTAHPSEARRRTVLEHLRSIAHYIARLDAEAPVQTPRARSALLDELRAAITLLWQTAQVRPSLPTPLHEVSNALYYFEVTLFDVAPKLYRDLEAALQEFYPGLKVTVPPFLRFGSWTGGTGTATLL